MPDDQLDPTAGRTEDPTGETPSEASDAAPAKKTAAKKAPAKRAAAKKAPAKKAPAKRAAKKAASPDAELPLGDTTDGPEADTAEAPVAASGEAPADVAPAKKTTRKAPARKTAKKATAKKAASPEAEPASPVEAEQVAERALEDTAAAGEAQAPAVAAPLFQAPAVTTTRRTRKTAAKKAAPAAEPETSAEDAEDAEDAELAAAWAAAEAGGEQPAPAAQQGDRDGDTDTDTDGDRDTDRDEDENEQDREGGGRRRRRRGGRRRRKSGEGAADSGEASEDGRDDDRGDAEPTGKDTKDTGRDSAKNGGRGPEGDSEKDGDDGSGEGTSRRRRRRRRSGEGGDGEDPEGTVTRVRKPRSAEDEITSIAGSTRLEAKKQRRRDGREAGRRRAPIVSEAEFLARRESVERVMVIRQREELTQIGVLEDKVLVEHYVARESQASLIGNVYLGRVQNVLPSMEAAFIDIGKGRNAVLYAGEVNWSALGHKEGQPRKIESVLSSGQSILVQVSKDPIGHKGARLTSQISLAGRFLVYVPDGTTSGISRKLPDTERSRLKALLKEIVPESAGVIVRTAAEGASEEELTRDVERLKARWEDIEKKAANKGAGAQLLYGEPDLTLKVVRDLFTEDFAKLVIEGDAAWETVQQYVQHVAPDLEDRLERYFPEAHGGKDVFATYRLDEQIAKALDRKVWLPSGGSLVIDRTEAMTVVDVNTGKFTGSGGNLEETVTKNNLEAAEEVVRQLRLRDIGGIIVVDFIDMVLESNRDLVLRRLVECLGRDRTKHQVAEVTSLGLVQMTRKRIGTGLVESFSENCEHCHGRGVVISDQPVEPRSSEEDRGRGGGRRRGKGRGEDQPSGGSAGGSRGAPKQAPTPKDIAAMARPEPATDSERDAGPDSGADAVETPAADTPAAQAPAADSAAAAQEAAEQPKVVTRSRRRGASRSTGDAGAPTEPVVAAPAAPAPAEPVTEPAREPAREPAQEPAAAAPATEVSQAPKVVTRTRGRSASRPAGQPGSAPAAPIVVEPEAPAATAAPAAPVAAAAETSATTPAPPRVVTRTRGTRTVTPAQGTDPATDPASADDSAPHVPVKKKGTRKR